MKTEKERHAELAAMVEKMRAELPPLVDRETVIVLVLEAMNSSIDATQEAIQGLAEDVARLQRALTDAPKPTHAASAIKH